MGLKEEKLGLSTFTIEGESFTVGQALIKPKKKSLVAGIMAVCLLVGPLLVFLFAGKLASLLLLSVFLFFLPVTLYAYKPLSSSLISKILPIVMRQVSVATHDLRSELLKGVKGRVLEIGCGSGEYWQHLVNAEQVVSLEPNQSLRSLLLQRASASRANIDLHSCFLHELPAAATAKPFDWLILGNVICELPDAQAVLRQANSLLRPGARIYFSEHVVGPSGSMERVVQRVVAPWWLAMSDGCHCDRDALGLMRAACPDWQLFSHSYRMGGLPWIRRFEIGLAHKKSEA